MQLKRIARSVLLNPLMKRSFSPVVDFYNNLPVGDLPDEFMVDNDKSVAPLFHVGNVMPLPDKSAIALEKVVAMARTKKMTAVEIGCWTGRSTSIIAEGVKSQDGHLFAVDHWQGSTGVWQYEVAERYNILSIFRENMEILGLSDVVHPLVMDSMTAAGIFKDACLDFISISADHRYTPVKSDIMEWLPKLKKGGILSGHACSGYYSKYSDKEKGIIDLNKERDDLPGLGHPGIIRALYDCFQDKYSIVPDSVVWYLRR